MSDSERGPVYRHGPRWSRGYLPHDDGRGLEQLVTFRLSPTLLAGRPPLIALPAALDLIAGALVATPESTASLRTWVVMPDHVHAVLRTVEASVGDLVTTWKRSTVGRLNRLLGRSGAVWAREFHDARLSRAGAVVAACAYVEANPVRARLCSDPLEWRWSGIHTRLGRTPPPPASES
jgi:hypothetical protein